MGTTSLALAVMTASVCFARATSSFYAVNYRPAQRDYQSKAFNPYYQKLYYQGMRQPKLKPTVPFATFHGLSGIEKIHLLKNLFKPMVPTIESKIPPRKQLPSRAGRAVRKQLSFEDRVRVSKVIKSILEITSEPNPNNINRLLDALHKMSPADVDSLKESMEFFTQQVDEAEQITLAQNRRSKKKSTRGVSPLKNELLPEETLKVMNILQTVLDVMAAKPLTLQLFLAERLQSLTDEDMKCLRKVVDLFSSENDEGIQNGWGDTQYWQDTRENSWQTPLPKKSKNGTLWKGVVASNIINTNRKIVTDPSISNQIQKELSLEDVARVRNLLQYYFNVMKWEPTNAGTIKSLLQLFLKTSQKDEMSLRKCLISISQDMAASSKRITNHNGKHDLSFGDKFKFVNTLQTILNVINAEQPTLQVYYLEQLVKLLRTEAYQKFLVRVVVLLSNFIASRTNQSNF